ncbi:MAG TPA: STAS domain-containing protein [Phycisphaerae bacterium]|nr:STAS domain-containing protein [Phycisphaerae bacterium]
MRIDEQKQGAVLVLKPTGPLVGESCLELKAALAGANQRTMGRYILDAAGVSFVDSTGLETLLEASEALIRGGRILKLCTANDTVRDALDLTGLADSFEHFPDVNAAVRSFL